MRGAMDDLELLWEFGRSRSPAAFETVARRYVDLIYSSALRQVRDPHVADDVTQAVLIVMMNKAAKLPARNARPAFARFRLLGRRSTPPRTAKFHYSLGEAENTGSLLDSRCTSDR